MRKLSLVSLVLFMFIGCCKHQSPVYQKSDHQSIIDEVCKDFSSDILTPEEIIHWDSLNANGGHLLVRDAERNLDTTVNHVHIIFITEP